MKILKTASRVYVNDLNEVLDFYETLLNLKSTLRVSMPEVGLELAIVGNIIIIAGDKESLKPFKKTIATLLVDSIDQFKTFLEEKGSKVIRGPSRALTGINMTVKHPDGSIFEYVEHKYNPTDEHIVYWDPDYLK